MKKIIQYKFILILLFLILLNKNLYWDYNCNIKWNVSFETWEKIYHLPDCYDYDDTIINKDYWEKYFCSEEEAIRSWWRKSKNCPLENQDNNWYIVFILWIIAYIIFMYFYTKKPN